MQTKSEFSPRQPNDRWHLKWCRVFPKAPFWSPAKFVKVPVLASPDAQSPLGEVLWQRKLVTAELQVRLQRLFPDAPQWSPLRKVQLPALRLTRKKSAWTRLKHHYYQQQERQQRMHQSH